MGVYFFCCQAISRLPRRRGCAFPGSAAGQSLRRGHSTLCLLTSRGFGWNCLRVYFFCCQAISRVPRLGGCEFPGSAAGQSLRRGHSVSFCMIEALDSVYFSSTRSHRESCPLLSARNRAIVGTIPESGAFLLDNASKLPDFVRTKCSAPHSVRKLWRYEVSIHSLYLAGLSGSMARNPAAPTRVKLSSTEFRLARVPFLLLENVRPPALHRSRNEGPLGRQPQPRPGLLSSGIQGAPFDTNPHPIS